MKILRFLTTLLALALPAVAQQVDYRALGPNAFFTNGLIVNSKHWTNETPFATFQIIRPVYQNRTIWSENVGTNHSAVEVTLFNTNNQDTTFTLYGWNKSTNSFPTAPYWLGGSYGAVFENAPSLGAVKAGDGIGVLGVSDGLWKRQIGVSGLALSVDNGQTNVAGYFSSLSAGKTSTTNIGIYVETGAQTQGTITNPNLQSGVIVANSRDGNFLLKGQTNGIGNYLLRSDGSSYIGDENWFSDAGFNPNDYSVKFIPSSISITDSNGPSNVRIHSIIIDNGNYGRESEFVLRQSDNGTAPTTSMDLYAHRGGGTITSLLRFFSDCATNGNDAINYSRNFSTLFGVSGDTGDLTKIKSVTYSWPTGYGAETNYVLTDTNKAGSLSWQPGLLSPTGTNIIRSIATNAVSQISIGPGTNNWFAKFNSTGTNVQNGSIFSSISNSVEFRPDPAGGTFNIGFTNKIIGQEQAGVGTNWLEFIAVKSADNQAYHIRGRQTGTTDQIAPIYINNSWSIEPDSGQGGGHAAGFLSPLVTDTYSIGSSSVKVKSMTLGTGFVEMGIPASTSFPGYRIGASDCGISSRGVNDLSFWRPTTGITAAFDKERNSAFLQFDLAGNYLGFGVGISNTVAFLGGNDQIIAGLGLLGVVQVGTNNNAVAAPLPAGFIGGPGVGTDKGGTDIKIIGGPSSGTGTNGNVRIQTSEKANASSSTINATQKDRLFVIADPIILTTNSATIVANITIPTALRGVGGQVIAHTEIENGVDIATTDETFMFTANRKGSTVVTGISAPVTCTSTSGGSAAIANTWTAVANSTSVDLKLTCVTSGILSTNSTVRVTIIPNSSAVPVITHP